MPLQCRSNLHGAGPLWPIAVIGIGVILSTPALGAETGLMFRFRNGSTLGAGVVLAPDPRLRFEPEIGFSFSDNESENNVDQDLRTDSASRYISFEAGLGVHYVLPHKGPFSVYVGPRGGYSRRDWSSEHTSSGPAGTGRSTSDENTDGWFASGVLGTDVKVTSGVSLGVEGEIVYRNSSSTQNSSSNAIESPSNSSASSTSTAFSILFRWFPWSRE